MPTYDYVCLECAKRFEIFKKSYSEDINIKCPDCKSKEVQKKFGTPTVDPNGFMFKESGMKIKV